MAARERYPQAVNLSIDVALLREARECDINLSATLERALSDAHGAFADTLRTF
jgi:post-segregation antitoxin (ccd killing protein)